MWDKKWPTKTGFYWAYGQFWSVTDFNGKPSKKELKVVEARKVANSMMYTVSNSFIYDSEDHNIFWQRIDDPVLPE